MRQIAILIKRNVKLFFKDKGMLFTSLITPLILLVLYATFLSKVYRDSFLMQMQGFIVTDDVIDGLVCGQLVSSLLAVSCVTVAFCSNFLMVQDKVNGTSLDFNVSPVKSHALSISYYIATLLSTLLVCFTALAVCFIYLAIVGWYLSFTDVLLLILDVFLLVLFGTALSSLINFFLSSQGQISAVGTIVSSCYGFICGAYMPISSFGSVLQRIIAFLPGTYGTSLMRNHALRGALAQMQTQGVSPQVIKALKDGVDCHIYFFDTQVGLPIMYAILLGTIIALVVAYVLVNKYKRKEK